jgi:hypothetical protein
LFGTQLLEEGQFQFLAVDVSGEVQQVRFHLDWGRDR